MALSITPFAVGTAATPLGAGLPPGPYYALVSAGSATATGIYVGEGAGVTASNGMYIPGGAPVPLHGFAGQGGQALYAVSSSGTVNASLMVSTPR